LRLEEERLKFERDTAFEAAMAGLARVRELELRQQELRERGMEMVRRGLKSLDELDEAESNDRRVEKEKEAERTQREVAAIDLGSQPDDLFVLSPSDPFWASLDSGGGTQAAFQGN